MIGCLVDFTIMDCMLGCLYDYEFVASKTMDWFPGWLYGYGLVA